jgi:hypothetical protein
VVVEGLDELVGELEGRVADDEVVVAAFVVFETVDDADLVGVVFGFLGERGVDLLAFDDGAAWEGIVARSEEAALAAAGDEYVGGGGPRGRRLGRGAGRGTWRGWALSGSGRLCCGRLPGWSRS